MSQEERFAEIVRRTTATENIAEQSVPPELEKPSSFLKLLNANHYNWQSPRFREIFGIRFSVKLPPGELNVITFPDDNYDPPIVIFFCMLTRRHEVTT